MICQFCGLRAWVMSGYKTIRNMRANIKWQWYECSNGHEWGHRRI